MSTGMLMFAAKVYNIPGLNDLLKTLIPNDVSAVCPLLCFLLVYLEDVTFQVVKRDVKFLSRVNLFQMSHQQNWFSSNQLDPYMGIGDDLQIYVRPQADVKEYGSFTDNQQATSLIYELRNKEVGS